jgi:putative FmdB family regulatory protein
MPIYEYRCLACGHQFEALVRANDTPVCESCHSTELERLLSMFAVSSESTRQSSLSLARKKNKKMLRDKAIADQEEIDHHRH